MQKKLTTLIIAMVTTAASPAANADDAAKIAHCEKRVRSCEEVLDKAFTALEAEREYATELERQNNRLQSALAAQQELLEAKDAWYRDPLLIGIVGVALGAFVGVKAASGN
jgi:uncharacterized protein involved in exopolysaccharide biosynthesis